MTEQWFNPQWPVGSGWTFALASAFVLLVLGLLVKNLAERAAAWLANALVSMLARAWRAAAAAATRTRAQIRAWVFSKSGRGAHRTEQSAIAVYVASRVTKFIRSLAGRHDVEEALDLVVRASKERGVRGAVAAGVGALVGVLDRRIAEDVTVALTGALHVVAFLLLAIGGPELVRGRPFGLAALTTSVVVYGVTCALQNLRSAPWPAKSCLLLIGPSGALAAWLSPRPEITVAMAAASALAAIAGLLVIAAARHGVVRALTGNETPSVAGVRYLTLAVRYCGASTFLFGCANVLQALEAPHLALKALYLLNAVALLAVTTITVKWPNGGSYGRMLVSVK